MYTNKRGFLMEITTSEHCFPEFETDNLRFTVCKYCNWTVFEGGPDLEVRDEELCPLEHKRPCF